MQKFKHDFEVTPYISESKLIDFYNNFTSLVLPEYQDYEQYYLGNNPTILKRKKDTSSGAPDWKIPVSYARKLVNTIVGYMFKPGNINYVAKEGDISSVKEILDYNDEPVKTSKLGRLCSTYGVGYELHYIQGDAATETAQRRFTPVDSREIIPIYNYDIEPTLGAFIRAYKKDDTIILDVYYSDTVIAYALDPKSNKLIGRGDTPNPYKTPPLVIFKNNEEEVSDFHPIRSLIDAYDILVSDSMNEFDRFAWAYLLMTQSIDKDDLKKIKELRIFQNLPDTQAVAFLTKEIPYGFISSMIDIIRFEIHNQSHVPNFTDVKTGEQISGVALDRLLYDFEFIAATKEAYFKDALYQRLALLDRVINIGEDANLKNSISIEMKRNKPTDKVSDASLYNSYYQKGISTTTLIKEFASFVEDPEQEKADFEEEQQGAAEKIPVLEDDDPMQDEESVNKEGNAELQ